MQQCSNATRAHVGMNMSPWFKGLPQHTESTPSTVCTLTPPHDGPYRYSCFTLKVRFNLRLCEFVWVSRCTLLILLAMSLGAWWVLEQPANSLMIHHPRLQALVKIFTTYQAKFAMGAYKGKSLKPTIVYSNKVWIEKFGECQVSSEATFPEGADVTKKYLDRDGNPRVTGGKGLKNTQTYPRKFGRKVRQIFRQCAQLSDRECSGQDMKIARQLLKMSPLDDEWADACLESVMTFVRSGPASSAT